MRMGEPGRSLLVSVNSLLPSAGRPGHRAAAENMSMHVPYRLPGVAARIEDDPVPAGGDPGGGGNLMGHCDQLVKQSVARAGQGRHVRKVVPGDHQDMRRRLRADVAEGDDPLSVSYDRGRDLSSSDPAEQAVWHSTIIVALQRRTVPDIASAWPPGPDACRVLSVNLPVNLQFAGTPLATHQ
jgi:hypothetical protein